MSFNFKYWDESFLLLVNNIMLLNNVRSSDGYSWWRRMWRHGSGKMHRSELFPRWKMNFENIDQILSFMYAHVKWWQTAETNFGKLVLHYRYFLLHYRTPLTCSNFVLVTIGENCKENAPQHVHGACCLGACAEDPIQPDLSWLAVENAPTLTSTTTDVWRFECTPFKKVVSMWTLHGAWSRDQYNTIQRKHDKRLVLLSYTMYVYFLAKSIN